MCMKKNYYRIAIERYFSVPIVYGLLLTVPVMVYGYYESDPWFWLGMATTVALLVLHHVMIRTLTRTFGIYATHKQVKYVSNFITTDCSVFTDKESDALKDMIFEQAGNDRIGIDDYINYINHLLEEKSKANNAEALFWLGMYYRMLGEADNHNSVARDFIEKSASLGFERAKKLRKKARKWV